MKRRAVFLVGLGLICLAPLARAAAESGAATQLRFAPGLRAVVRGAITDSQTSVDVMVYKLTDRGLIKDLSQAGRRGVRVRVILCPTQTSNQKAAAKIKQAGAAVRWYPLDRPNRIMHVKLAVFDQARLLFGSANWTYWGMTLHHESILDTTQAELVAQSVKQFELDWEKSKP